MSIHAGMSTRWARVTRGLLAASFATAIAAVSHFLAGGGTPNGVSIALVFAFSALVCIALTGRQLSLLRMSLAVAVSQMAFHVSFATIGGATGHVVSGGHHSVPSIVLNSSVLESSIEHHTSGWMWLAHALAAVATIVVLRRGEAAFWGMRDTALRFFAVAFTLVPVVRVSPRTAPVVVHVEAPRHFVFLLGSLQHRGPPALSF